MQILTPIPTNCKGNIYKTTQFVSLDMCNMSFVIYLLTTTLLRSLEVWVFPQKNADVTLFEKIEQKLGAKMLIKLCVTCQTPCVKSQMSCVTCHMSPLSNTNSHSHRLQQLLSRSQRSCSLKSRVA